MSVTGSAIHQNFFAGDEEGLFAGQKLRHIGHVVRGRHAAQWNRLEQAPLVGVAVADVGENAGTVDGARNQRVDRHLAVAQLQGQYFDEILGREFAGAV